MKCATSVTRKIEAKLECTKLFIQNKAGCCSVLAQAKSLPCVASVLHSTVTKDIQSSKTLSKIGFYSGVGSILIGFPANVIGVIAGVAVEDRRRLAGEGNFKKVAAKTLELSAKELTKSRIGLLAGAVSLTFSVVALAAHLSVKSHR